MMPGRDAAVQICLSPPHSLACFPTLCRSDEIGAWGAIPKNMKMITIEARIRW